MSKIKISELAKELGVESKEVVSFLQEKGVESAKRSTSSVEDDDADKARKHFGKNGASNAPQSKAADSALDDNKREKEVKEDKNTIAADKTPKAGQAAADNQPTLYTDASCGIINGQGRNGQNGRNNSFASSQNVYHPIKPKTAPSQLEYESNIRKTEDKPAAPKNVQPVKPANTETAPKAQEAAPAKVETEVKTEVKNDVKKPQVNENKQAESNQSAQPRDNRDNKNSGNQGRNFEDRRQGQNRNDRNAGGFRNGQGRNDRNDRNDRGDRNGRHGKQRR